MKKNGMLEGSIFKNLLLISLPIIFANILQTVYQLIDTFWVGRLGTEAVASVSLSFPILFFLMSLAMGLSMAGSIFVAQYNGQGNKRKVALVTGQTLALVSGIGLILSIVGYFSSEFLLSFLTNDPLVLSQAVSYLKISFIGMVAMFIYNIFQSSLRGIGEVKFPMYVVLGTVVINFFIDPLFMFGWGIIPAMGVAGVALATVITQTLSAVIGLYVLFSASFGIKLKLKDLKLKRIWIKKLFKLGIPSSLESSSRSFGMVVMTFIVASFGTLVVASYGIGTRILSFIIIPAIGLAIATSALVGNNLGAKLYERAIEITKVSMKFGFVILTIVGILLFILAKPIAAFFVPGETDLVVMSANFIRIMALTFGLVGIQMVIIGALKAAGRASLSMALAMFHTLFLIILSYVLAVSFGLNELGIWIAYPLANFLSVCLALYFYFKKDFLAKKLV